MTGNNPEYEALDRVITADKRLKKFQYLLAATFFVLVVLGAYGVQQSISKKIDALVTGSVTRNNIRQAESVTISRETIRYITCIFVVPIDQRTPETQQKCFEAADLPGGLTRNDFSPVVIPSTALGAASSGAIQAQYSQPLTGASSSETTSPDNSTTSTPSQPNSSQPPWAVAPPPSDTTILQQAQNLLQNVLRVRGV